MKKGRRLLLWPPVNSLSLPTEQEAEPQVVVEGCGRQEEVAEAYFPAKEEPPAAPTVLSRETRATPSVTERRRTEQTAAAEPLWLLPALLRPSGIRGGPDGRRAAAAPLSERLHGQASRPPSCVQTGNALIADCAGVDLYAN